MAQNANPDAAGNPPAVQQCINRDIQMTAFSPGGDPDENGKMWERWKKELETRLRYFRITETPDKVDAISIYGGERVRELIELLPNRPAPQDVVRTEYEEIIAKLDHYFQPSVNSDSARARLDKLQQMENETMAQYYVRLRKIAADCAFPDRDDAIRSKILNTMRDKKLRREAMVKNYSLSDLLKNAATKEDVDRQAKQIEGETRQVETTKRVYAKSKYPPKPKETSQPRKDVPQKSKSPKTAAAAPTAKSGFGIRGCQFCGYQHEMSRNKCPASGQTCRKCGKLGHFAKKCKPRDPAKEKKQVRCVLQDDDSSDSSEFAFKVTSGQKSAPTVDVKVNGVKCRMDADSCSSVNLIDETRLEKLQAALSSKIRLRPTTTEVYAFGQDKPLGLRGVFTALVYSLKSQRETQADFYVVKGTTKSRPLLCLSTCAELRLLPPVEFFSTNAMIAGERPLEEKLMEKYPQVFEGLGKHNRITASLIVDPSVAPVCLKQRKIPYNLAKKAKEEEERLKKIGVIEEVPRNEPTTWCTNPVIAPKPHNPSAIRYCSDMRVPNTAIKRPVCEIMTVEDLKVKLNGARVFSILDMNEGYHQLELDRDSRYITTFYGTKTKMRYTRLNYGTISAQDIFDKAMDDTITGLEGVCHIRDDFIVYGCNDQDHDNALEGLIRRFAECNLTFNPKKCKFRVPKIEFFGFTFSGDGVQPAPSKIEALKLMTPPSSVQEVRSLIGMAQYSAQFIPNFAELTAPLRQLTHKDAKWQWTAAEKTAFNTLRDVLSTAPVLGYYETGLPTKLTVDAGPNGLGLILFQLKDKGWQPVACASRSLTVTEKKYSQIEREALAVRWACERCYMYLIGSRFIIETDHQPLIPLFTKPHSQPPMRIERWLLYLQQFDYEMKYCPGSRNAADYLSRHSLPLTQRDAKKSEERDLTVHHIIADTVPVALDFLEVRDETARDRVFCKLAKTIQSGDYYGCKKDPDLKPYSRVFRELSYIEGIILRGSRIVLPTSLQRRAVKLCHEGHLGIMKTKQLCRSKLWFPGLDRCVEEEVASCIPCQASVPQKSREPLRMTTLPEGPWTQASADFCGPFPTGEYVLLLIDDYSRYPEVEVIESTSASTTIPALRKMFATHGVPEQIKTDNGPPFQGEAFREFAREKGFTHRRITPEWPEANGEAENFMKSIGKAAKTAHVAGKNWKAELYTFLGNYRDTPHPSTGKTPYDLSMGRSVRTKIPTIRTEMKSTPAAMHEEIARRDQQAKTRMKVYADERRNTKPSVIHPGDAVLVKQHKKNKLSTPFEPNPYVVETVKGPMITAQRMSDGRHTVRNSSHFKRLKQPAEVYRQQFPRQDEDLDECPPEPESSYIQDIHQPQADEEYDSQENVAREEFVPVTPHATPRARITSTPTPVETGTRTRSGRLSQKPLWLKDYE